MKQIILASALMLSSAYAFAFNPAVEAAAAKMKADDTRTIVTEIKNAGGGCLPSGKSYQVELQVKSATFDHMKNKVVYYWETIKTINVDKLGRVMEVCAE